MLYKTDFKTLWEIAFRWEGLEPPKHDFPELPEAVTENIYRISWAFFRRKFPLRKESGRRVLDGEDLLDEFLFNRSRNKLIRCLQRKIYPQKFLDGLYILRADLMKWCAEEFIEPPGFWIEKPYKPLVGRHKNQEQDKQLCQAIARCYWDLDPNIHPAHMARCKAIRIYGNGGHYEEDTVKGWIVEYDPQRDQRKPGRPPAADYLIDLENGCLSEERIKTLGAKVPARERTALEKTNT